MTMSLFYYSHFTNWTLRLQKLNVSSKVARLGKVQGLDQNPTLHLPKPQPWAAQGHTQQVTQKSSLALPLEKSGRLRAKSQLGQGSSCPFHPAPEP